MMLLPLLAPAMLGAVFVLVMILGDASIRKLRSARIAAAVIVITLVSLVAFFVLDYRWQSLPR
jgi:hypothetical protein